jgi:hypothetical protein
VDKNGVWELNVPCFQHETPPCGKSRRPFSEYYNEEDLRTARHAPGRTPTKANSSRQPKRWGRQMNGNKTYPIYNDSKGQALRVSKPKPHFRPGKIVERSVVLRVVDPATGIPLAAPSVFSGKGRSEYEATRDLINRLKNGYISTARKMHECRIKASALETMVSASALEFQNSFIEAQVRDLIANGQRETQLFIKNNPKYKASPEAMRLIVQRMSDHRAKDSTFAWTAENLRVVWQELIAEKSL